VLIPILLVKKMNIDMGDFFGGAAEGAPTTKKEPVKPVAISRFGFNLISSKKSTSTSRNSTERPGSGGKSADLDAFDNPFNNPVPASKPAVASKPSQDLRITPKTAIVEPKQIPRVPSVRDPNPPRYLPPRGGSANLPPSSPLVSAPKGSQRTIDSDFVTKGSNKRESSETADAKSVVKPAQVETSATPPSSKASEISQPQLKAVETKSPPPLPPRRVSTLNETAPVVNPSANSPAKVDKTVEDQPLSTSKPVENAKPTEVNETEIVQETEVNKTKIVQDKVLKEEGKVGVTIEKATGSGIVDAPAKSDELRSAIAPWTVWSEDPEKTLLNDDLRHHVAPWTDPDVVVPQVEIEGKKDIHAHEQNSHPQIAMDAFFSKDDDDGGRFGDEEFENPLLSMDEAPKEEEMISKPGIKKTLLFTSSNSTSGDSIRKPSVFADTHAAPIREELKKVIDYGEIFKAKETIVDDEADDLINDPEFQNAPDFEW